MVIRLGSRLKENMFVNQKNIDLYLELTNGPLNYVCKKLGINYSHSLHLIRLWENKGLIILNKSGFRYNMFYTAKGKRLEEALIKIRRMLKRMNIQW